MEFPRLVYKDGGAIQRAGGSYSHLVVRDEIDFKAAIATGWHATLPEAIDAINARPAREELEFKATQLGIKFDGRTTDRKLGELINNSIAGKKTDAEHFEELAEVLAGTNEAAE